MRELLNITRALSDENRVRILMSLRDGELCVCQIIEMLGLAPSTVSKHLSILYQACLVESRKEGRWIYYQLGGQTASPCVKDAIRWLGQHLQKDAQVVEDVKRLKAICRMDKDKLCCTLYKG
jgi:ArsR family transcriptional regulator, arsenate/arsenite/antimonite-responsive transcriptional repressor